MHVNTLNISIDQGSANFFNRGPKNEMISLGGRELLKGAIVAKTTWAHWHTCSLLFNFTQHLCSVDIK